MLLGKIRNSIKAKILTLVFISIVISFAILGVENTVNSYTAQYNLIKQQEIDLVKQNSKFIDSFIESKIDIMESIVDELQGVKISNDNPRVTNTFMLAKKAGNFVDVYVGYEKDGSLLLANKDVLNLEKDNYDARKRPWYIDALKANKAIVSKPYLDVITKKLIVSVVIPFRQEDNLIGVVGSDIFIDTIVNTILNINIDGLGVASLLDENGVTLIHKNKELMNKKDTSFSLIKANENYGFGEVSDEMTAFSKINTTGWNLILKLPKDKIYEEIDKQVVTEIITYIVLLLIISGLIFYSLNRLLSPIKAVEQGFNYFFRYLKGSENNIKKLDINTTDEFGNMAKVINKEMQIIADTLNEDRKLIENVKEVVSNVKDGRLDVEVQNSTQNKSLNELKDILNDMIHTININVNKDINVILSHLEEYAKLNFTESIPDANGNIAKGLNDLSNIINEMLQENKQNGLALDESSNILLKNVDILNTSSNQTAVSLEETAAALEEITSTVESNSSRIQEMTDHSNELTQNIREGQDLATSTVTSMDEINDQTKSIAEAITVIDQIAFQTNILSLNAAVEAATAGEAGKGFAVVAQEVRNLASRSAEAAKEIKELVESATSKTDNGKNIADKMIKGYEKLNSSIAKTTEAITDIAESSREQKTSIQQINEVINRLDQQSQNNAAVATQTHEIAGNTSKLANTILETVNKKRFRES